MYCFYCLLKKVWKKVFPDIFFGLLSSETGFGKPDVTMSGWSQMRREGKIWNLSFFLIFIDFIEKELSTKFCGVLIIFHEVMTANVQNISSLFFLHTCVHFMKNDSLTMFSAVFDHFSESYKITKSWNIRRCLDVSWCLSANELNNMLIVAYM